MSHWKTNTNVLLLPNNILGNNIMLLLSNNLLEHAIISNNSSDSSTKTKTKQIKPNLRILTKGIFNSDFY